MMDLALMRPGTPRYWMPFLSKMVAPACHQATWFVPSSSSGTMQPAHTKLRHDSCPSHFAPYHCCTTACKRHAPDAGMIHTS